MTDVDHIRQVYCACGHSALVDLGTDLQLDEVIYRLRCSVCGGRAATHAIKPASDPSSGCDPVRDLERQRAEGGW